jgi:hypothetical protein
MDEVYAHAAKAKTWEAAFWFALCVVTVESIALAGMLLENLR